MCFEYAPGDRLAAGAKKIKRSERLAAHDVAGEALSR
jgi:hypothetical protein